ncbi:MAG: hypothetical protein NTX53_20665 [candidate division WOR-3 bacterium]|nr:hypothetical protein [candidate division WOR-3 bacterium]
MNSPTNYMGDNRSNYLLDCRSSHGFVCTTRNRSSNTYNSSPGNRPNCGSGGP